MSRRLLYVAAGLAVALIAAHRAAAAAQAAVPADPAPLETGGSVPVERPTSSLRTFVEDVRTYAAEREAELREALGLDGTHDVVDAAL